MTGESILVGEDDNDSLKVRLYNNVEWACMGGDVVVPIGKVLIKQLK